MRLKMSKDARKELLKSFKPEYGEATKGEKTLLLRGFLKATGYSRGHALALLNSVGPEPKPKPRMRHRVYDEPVVEALKKVWFVSNRICSKRLCPFMEYLVNSLERHGHLKLTREVKSKLLSLSPSTADRLLRREKQKYSRGRSNTRPGALLKRQIEVRTFADWNDVVPGFFEADCVAHCGAVAKGSFLSTLTLTDIATGWTECRALPNKTESAVAAALSAVAELLPFPIKGFDSDNGSEFINSKVIDWCTARKVTFTRSREYKKNDQAHVEEKNGSIVRRYVGYDRFEGEDSRLLMEKLYSLTSIYVNLFQPSMKLRVKERDGGKVTKHYEEAKTPAQRLIESKISTAVKAQLKRRFRNTDPVKLLAEIEQTQIALWKTSVNIDPASVAETSLLRILESTETTTSEELASRLSIHRQNLRKKRKKAKVSHPIAISKDEPIQALVRKHISKLPSGTTFGPKDLLHICSRAAADTILSRLAQRKVILKVGWGRYVRPMLEYEKTKNKKNSKK